MNIEYFRQMGEAEFDNLLNKLASKAKKPRDGDAWIVGEWDRDEEGAVIVELIRRYKELRWEMDGLEK